MRAMMQTANAWTNHKRAHLSSDEAYFPHDLSGLTGAYFVPSSLLQLLQGRKAVFPGSKDFPGDPLRIQVLKLESPDIRGASKDFCLTPSSPAMLLVSCSVTVVVLLITVSK